MARRLPMENHRPELIEHGVGAHEQTMTLEKPFWLFFSANTSVGTVMLGVVLAGMGFDFWKGLAVLFLGNLIGSIPPALTSTLGPRTRLTQMESSRLALGKRGVRLPSFLCWLNCFGWDAVNNVPATFAWITLAALCGLSFPFWLTLAVLVIVQGFISVYGHHLVQAVGKAVGYLFFLTFVVLGVLAFQERGLSFAAAKPVSLAGFLLAVTLIASAPMGWCGQAADYTRYLPPATPAGKVFLRVFLGIFLSGLLEEVLGLLLAGGITDQTPQGIVRNLQHLAGPWAPAALVLMGISSLSSNAANDNSAAYCLISAGVHISRRTSAVIGAALSYAIAVYGAGSFSAFLENFLLLMVYWIAPWTAIVLTDWFLTRRKDHTHPPGWTREATIFCVVTAATLLLFSSSPLYTGPVNKWLGGAEVGYYAGFLWAGIWTWLTLRRRKAA
ncbi:MAG: cytosine permease [Verrucomicrobium sp.]|nr:cytosine permease [Verrucomicrobium sp.]